MQTEVVLARHTIIWTGQDCSTGNSSRRETKSQTEIAMGRQHQRVDWPRAEYREEWRKLVAKLSSDALMISQTKGKVKGVKVTN